MPVKGEGPQGGYTHGALSLLSISCAVHLNPRILFLIAVLRETIRGVTTAHTSQTVLFSETGSFLNGKAKLTWGTIITQAEADGWTHEIAAEVRSVPSLAANNDRTNSP